MKRIWKILALLTAVMCLAAVLCACGDGKPGGTEGNEGSVSGSPASDSGKNGIVVAIAQDLDDSLDPHHMEAAGTREVLFNVFEGLVKPDSEGNLLPAVAKKYVVSKEADVFTFELREGVRFHNGELVTVGDVLYSLERCMSKGEDGATLVDGFEAVKSVEAPDEKTIVITLTEGNTAFLARLTAAIIPADYDGQATAPVGTGPFRFVSRTPQQNFIVERFDEYWGEKAKLEKVEFRIFDNATAIVMALKSGAVDFCAHLTQVQTNELGSDFTILEGTMNLVQAVYLNNAVEPLDDIRVRQALSYAIDREQIMLFLADGRGTALGSSIYPAFGKYFMPELADYYPTNVEKAKELLTEAGYPDGFPLVITVPSNYAPHVDTATVVVEQLRAIGVDASINIVEWSTWLSDIYQGRNYEATVVGFDAKTLTAQALLDRWRSDSSSNISNFSNAEYDRVYAEACACVDDAEQTELFKRCETILTEQAANLYIQDLCDLVAMKSTLDGYKFYPIYAMDLSTVYYK